MNEFDDSIPHFQIRVRRAGQVFKIIHTNDLRRGVHATMKSVNLEQGESASFLRVYPDILEFDRPCLRLIHEYLESTDGTCVDAISASVSKQLARMPENPIPLPDEPEEVVV